jgi:uncharacterized protein YdaU (DUF1376 family)
MFVSEKSKPSEKLKAWYLFTDDFVAGTQHLTPLELGCYVRLLVWNWNKRCRGIPDNAEMHNRICSAHNELEQEAVGDVINEFFNLIIDNDNIENNRWQNARQLQEWLYINKRIDNARENGKKGGRPKNPDHNPEETPLPLPHTPTNNNNNILFENEIWDKITIKRGSKEKAFKAWNKLNNKIDNNLLVNKFNELINNTEDKKFVPHLSTWINDKRWEEALEFNKTNDNEFGLIQRDPFRNLSFWKKGRKMPNDIDSDIEIMHKKGEISNEAMKQMGFLI